MSSSPGTEAPLVGAAVPDPPDVPPFAGPLAGVLAGLDWMANHAPEETMMVTASVDAPFLPDDLVTKLLAARPAPSPTLYARLAVTRSNGRMHPVFALWDVSFREELRDALVSDGLRKIGLWMTLHKAVDVVWPGDPLDPFFNVNTPDDVKEADRIARQLSKDAAS